MQTVSHSLFLSFSFTPIYLSLSHTPTSLFLLHTRQHKLITTITLLVVNATIPCLLSIYPCMCVCKVVKTEEPSLIALTTLSPLIIHTHISLSLYHAVSQHGVVVPPMLVLVLVVLLVVLLVVVKACCIVCEHS